MAMSAWTMEQSFRFPAGCGEAVRAESVNVTPQYTDELTEHAYRLTGIYHVTCMAVFDGEAATPNPEGATMIDEIDMNGETGYFEYAVPLYIDLPAETGDGASLKSQDVRAHITDDGALCISWKVDCLYGGIPDDESESSSHTISGNAEAEKKTAQAQESSSSPFRAAQAEAPAIPAQAIAQAEQAHVEAEAELPRESTSSAGAYRADDISYEEVDEARAFAAGLKDTYTVFSYPSYKILVKRESESD